jgi:hypothetical protein
LNRVPQQIPRYKRQLVFQESLEIADQANNPAILDGVICHGLAIGVRIENLGNTGALNHG